MVSPKMRPEHAPDRSPTATSSTFPRSDGLRYAVCPEIRDPRNSGIAPDAFLNTARKPDRSPLDQAFTANFASLQTTGDWLH